MCGSTYSQLFWASVGSRSWTAEEMEDDTDEIFFQIEACNFITATWLRHDWMKAWRFPAEVT